MSKATLWTPKWNKIIRWFEGEIYTLKMYRHLSSEELSEKFIYRHSPEDIEAKRVELGL